MISTAATLALLAPLLAAAGEGYSFDPQAVVLGRSLHDAALDPDTPLEALLARVEDPVELDRIKVRALAFADLHLRGLKRFCIVENGERRRAPLASFAHVPVEAFGPGERRQTARLLPRIEADIDAAWQGYAARYHDEIRSLKRDCPGIPRNVEVTRRELKKWMGVVFAASAPLRSNLQRLADNTVETIDVESAFPRVQFAANALSYHLGQRAVEDPALLASLRGFVARYQVFSTDSTDRTRLLDQALEGAENDLGSAVWIITFAFRNLPHLYDVYLLDPAAAAKLEILFLRLRHYRRQLSQQEEKMLLHYPVGIYAAGDRRSSPYHFWSGGYVALEMLRKGHPAEAAALVGGAAQGGYEVLSALTYTLRHERLHQNPLRRMLHFFDRSATWEDAAGGMLGAFGTLDVALERRASPLTAEYRLLRTEARRFARYVKDLKPVYESMRED